ncbi:MAG: hypothetical protein V3W19_03950 [Desulfatiglandales bacterium]
MERKKLGISIRINGIFVKVEGGGQSGIEDKDLKQLLPAVRKSRISAHLVQLREPRHWPGDVGAGLLWHNEGGMK